LLRAWFHAFNLFTYASTALTLNEFDGLVLVDEQGQRVDALAALRQAGRLRNNLSLWANIGVLAGMLVALRLVAFALLARKVRPSRLGKVALAAAPQMATSMIITQA
jgi:hypothetical protein